MDVDSVRKIVDHAPPQIAPYLGDLERLYDYVGLPRGSAYTTKAVSEGLYARIRNSFSSGHATVWRACRSLLTDLVRQNVLNGVSLDPYFEVLVHVRDAVRGPGDPRAPIEGDWDGAIRAALDHVRLQSMGTAAREISHARDFAVARIARHLRDAGFGIRLEPGLLALDASGESRLVAAIENLVATMGGLNVARRLFEAITPAYDPVQQRYHVVRHVSQTGGGRPQTPWGYLLQLAVKHLHGRKPYVDSDDQWRRLCELAMAYASVIDVQPYVPTFFGGMDAVALVPYLQEMAVYDTLFRIPQMRPTDVVKVARGMLGSLDASAPTRAGWSIDQALAIIGYILDPSRDVRGPMIIDEADIGRACPGIPPNIITQILDQVLSHPAAGANQRFSRPTDAPSPDDVNLKDAGHDFFLRPLLRLSGRRFLLIDRSVCAPNCLEALLTPLRSEVRKLDDEVGSAIERFLEVEFAAHGVSVRGGSYVAQGEHGECDIVLETPDVVFFCEMKKKTLTRRARAGSDIHLLLDLSASLLAAQAQAGWHEVRLRRDGYLDLERNGTTTRLELKARQVERMAVSLFDFGSFQDRILLKQFMEATMNAKFGSPVAELSKKLDEINDALAEVREQVATLHLGSRERRQPFFHCWFVSVPQLLVVLDDVMDGDSLKSLLWTPRHTMTGSSDFYFELSHMRKWKQAAAEANTSSATEKGGN
jgi:hypothetical protein